jgi:hypothetical protein
MLLSIKRAAIYLTLTAGIMACSPGPIISPARLTGTWQQTGRKCPGGSPCSIKENALTLTIRPDGKLILRSGGQSAKFNFIGESFYRIYTPDRRLAFSFEIVTLSEAKLTILLYNYDMQKQDTYSFDRTAYIEGI